MDLGFISMSLKLDISNLTANLKEAEASIKATEEQFSGWDTIGTKITDTGKTLTTGLTLPILGAGTAAVKFASDMETNLAKISTIADTTAVPIDDLKQGIINLSNETGESTDVISEGFYQAISSGVETTEVIDFMSVAVKASKAGFTDTATAVDGLTTVLNSYGLETANAEEITNQLMIAQNLGKTTIGEMASSLGNVTPIASQLGVQTEELFSSLAVLTANGIGTSEAITGLKSSFSNIVKPSKEASDAAEALGLEFNSSAVQSKGWQGFLTDVKVKLQEVAPEYAKATEEQGRLAIQLAEMEKAGQKNTEAYKTLSAEYKEATNTTKVLESASSSQLSAFAKMFGSVEGLNTVLTLTSEQGMSLYNESMGQMTSGSDELTTAFETMNSTTESQMKQLKEQFKNTLAEVGTTLIPIVTDVMKSISDLLKKFNEMSPESKKMIIAFLGIVAVIGPTLIIFGKLMSSITAIKTGFTTLSSISKAFKFTNTINQVTKLGGVFGKLKGAMSLTKIVGLVTNPITIIIASIVGIIAVVMLVIKYWDEIKAVTIAVWDSIKEFFKAFGEWFSELWTGIKDWVVTKWTEIIDFFKTIPGAINEAIKGFFDGLGNWFSGIFSSIQKTIIDIWKNILSFFASIPTNINNAIKGFFDGLGKWFSGVFESVKNSIVDVWNNIFKFFADIPSKVMGAVSFIKDLPRQALTWGKDMVMGFIKGIKNSMGGLIDSVKGIANSIKSFLHFSVPDEGPLTDYETWMPDFIEGMSSGIENNKYKLVDTIKGMAQDMTVATKFVLAPSTGGIAQANINRNSIERQSAQPLTVNFYGTQVRNDNDIDKISRSIYNENMKVIRGMGRR